MDRWKYGLVALVIGAAALITALLLTGLVWDKNAAALGTITGAVGTIVGAYFGLQAGGAEAADAKNERNDAKQKRDNAVQAAMHLATKLPEDQAQRLLQQYKLIQ